MTPSRSHSMARGILTGCLVLLGWLGMASQPPPVRAATHYFTVNSVLWQADASKGDGACATAGGTCTLRAAVEEASALGATAEVRITLLGFTYPILDTLYSGAGKVTIIGNGDTVITGRNGTEVLAKRLFEDMNMASSAELVLEDLTLREGHGGALRFHGLGGSVVLRNVTVQQFTAEKGAGAFVSGLVRLTVTESVFDHNLANGVSDGSGGAVACFDCPLDVSGSTFSDNFASVRGGAVWVRGYANPTFVDCAFLRNTAPDGGAVYATEARLRVNGGTFSGNTANYGGALYLGPANNQTWIEEAVIADNVAAFEGGGIYQHADQTAVLVARCRVNGNSALRGGGILQDGGYLTVSQSGLVNNVSTGTASGDGGAGVYGRQTLTGAGRLRFVNSTLSGNVAQRSGGGLYLAEDAVGYLTSSTITGNTANNGRVSSYGGGLWVHDTTICSIGNTIIAGNEMLEPSAGGPYFYVPDVRGDIISRGYNLIGIWSDLYAIGGEGTGDQVGSRTTPVDPGLDVLRLVDGCVFQKIDSVPYHPVLPVSRAINTADPAGIFSGPPDFTTALTVDQCGNPRIQQARGDIGALESPYTRHWWPFALYLPAILR